jgi:PAP2 superfamily
VSVGSVIEVKASSVEEPPSLVVVPSAEKPKRSRIAVELGWLLFLVFIYDWLQDLAPLRRNLAFVNARALLSFEESIGLDPERVLDHWLSHQDVLAFIVSSFYSNGIFVVTFSFAAVLWWSRPDLYRPLRNDLVLTNLIGFAVFWAFPVAPPRMLSGYIDVVSKSGGLGSWHGSLIKHADQLAAMPSMHIGYAVWCSLVAWRLARKHSAKVAAIVFGIGYPLLTALVVMATGNHYLLDVLAGAACSAIAVFAIEVAPRLLRRLVVGSAAGWTTPFQQAAFQQAAFQQVEAQRQAGTRSSIGASRPSGTPLP